MATIEQRTGQDGAIVYRVKVRRKGYPTQTATFARRTDARTWAQVTEAAMLEGRHFTTTEAKRRTLSEAIARYLRDVLPQKSPSSIYMQTLQLRWWQVHIGHHILADVSPALPSAAK